MPSLIIIGSSGVMTFITAPDYETKSSYSVTVKVSDGQNSVSQGLTISVTDVNDNNPVISSLTTYTAAENQTAIGTVTATDGDASDSHYLSQYQGLNYRNHLGRGLNLCIST